MKITEAFPSQRKPHQTPEWLQYEIARAQAHYKRGERGHPWLHGAYVNHMRAVEAAKDKIPLGELMQMRPARWCWCCETELHYTEAHCWRCGPEFPWEEP